MRSEPDEKGLLDDLGKSRRFKRSVQNDLAENKKNRISDAVKYGKKYREKSEPTTGYTPLTIPQQLRIAAGFKQAIVKITSYGKGSGGVFKHMEYISRDFDIPLEDNHQALIYNKEETKDLLSSWNAMYFGGRKNARDTVNIVFSAPEETDRNTFKTLTREFLREEYGDEHDYVFTAHNDTAHPHIHAVICLRSVQDKKLDPRKQYIEQLRQRFAKKCREHGVMVEASRRFERGLAGQSAKSDLVQMRTKRKVTPRVDKQLFQKVTNEHKGKAPVADTGDTIRKKRNHAVREQFQQSVKTLLDTADTTSDPNKRKGNMDAAKLLSQHAISMQVEMTRADYLKQSIGKINKKLDVGKEYD